MASSSSAIACIRRYTPCISTIRSSRLWRLDVLRDPAFHSFSVQPSGLAERHGVANAAAEREHPAVLHFSSIHKPAGPGILVSGSLRQFGSPFRRSRTASPTRSEEHTSEL